MNTRRGALTLGLLFLSVWMPARLAAEVQDVPVAGVGATAPGGAGRAGGSGSGAEVRSAARGGVRAMSVPAGRSIPEQVGIFASLQPQGLERLRLRGPLRAPVRQEYMSAEGTPAAGAMIEPTPAEGVDMAQDAARHSPGWARFTVGLLTGAGAMIGVLAATWSSTDDGSDVAAGAMAVSALAAGTMVGSSIATGVREKPNHGLFLGALAGALPVVIAAAADNDGVAQWSLLAGVIGSPLGATLGQSWARE